MVLIFGVLNLIINGIPSILLLDIQLEWKLLGFKPYYKWNTFNTDIGYNTIEEDIEF